MEGAESMLSQAAMAEKRKRKGEKHRYKKQHRRSEGPGYPSDLTDREWEIMKDLIPDAKPGGRPRKYNKRKLLEAILYVLRTGCQWRMLPKDFPPWQLVYHYFQRWGREGVITRIHNTLRREVRRQAGREETPSAVIIDSQSVKTTSKGGSVVTMRERRLKAESAISS